jgi:hypothetical protein
MNEFKINEYNDRMLMVQALANSGYKVCIIEKKKDFSHVIDYYVRVEEKEKENG